MENKMSSPSKSVKLKEKQVKEIAKRILEAKSLMIVSIAGLPSKQFNSIKKVVREHASVQVAKKNIMIRAIKKVGEEKKAVLDLEKHITADCAFVISNLDGYELAGILASKKTPAYAKAGQVAPGEIEVKAGPTDLVPGPAISELGAFGIQVAVEDGKISIKADKVIASEGDKITTEMASLLQKLNIQPLSVGLEPKVVFDVQDEKIYTELKVDPEGYVEELRNAAGKALGFAQKIVYYCKETIGYFLGKANAEGDKLSELNKSDDSTTPESNDADISNLKLDKEGESSSEDERSAEQESESSQEVQKEGDTKKDDGGVEEEKTEDAKEISEEEKKDE